MSEALPSHSGWQSGCIRDHMPRWMFTLPDWLVGFFLIVFFAFYFAFHAPAVMAMLLVGVQWGGGVWAMSHNQPR